MCYVNASISDYILLANSKNVFFNSVKRTILNGYSRYSIRSNKFKKEENVNSLQLAHSEANPLSSTLLT